MVQQALVTDMDMDRLSKVIELFHGHTSADNLETRLVQAHVVEQFEAPEDLVTMNTTVRCAYEEGEHVGGDTLTVVYPAKSLLEYGRISVLAPLGTALLGSRKGESVAWKGPDGLKRSLTVAEILYQPEAAQDWDK